MHHKFKKFLIETILGLEYHDKLNPALWDNHDELYPEVRSKLLEFAKAFQVFGHIPDEAVKDVWLVGGNAGYNYSQFSDIDVHVIIQKGLVGTGLIIDEYLKSLKLLWSAKHNVKIRGYNIEPYFQDSNEPIQSAGIYSLRTNTWIRKPTHDPKNAGYDSSADLKDKIKHYQDLIKHMVDQKASVEAFHELKKKLSDMRKEGLAKGGEYSEGNLIFKGLRNSGYLDKMNLYLIHSIDHTLSL